MRERERERSVVQYFKLGWEELLTTRAVLHADGRVWWRCTQPVVCLSDPALTRRAERVTTRSCLCCRWPLRVAGESARPWTRLAGSEPRKGDCQSWWCKLAVLPVLAQHCDIYRSIKIWKIHKICGFFWQVYSSVLWFFLDVLDWCNWNFPSKAGSSGQHHCVGAVINQWSWMQSRDT